MGNYLFSVSHHSFDDIEDQWAIIDPQKPIIDSQWLIIDVTHQYPEPQSTTQTQIINVSYICHKNSRIISLKHLISEMNNEM